MSTLLERQQKLVHDMAQISDWEERYMKIIDMGKKLAPMDEAQKVEKNLIKGCQSQVWLHASLSDQGKVLLVGDSDALIVKGLVALVLEIFSNSTPSEILSDQATFLKEIGLDQHLSPSRSNGLHSMLKQVKMYALAFDYILKTKTN